MLVDEIRKIYDENIDRVNEQFDLEVKIHNEKILKQFDEEFQRIINEVKEAARNGNMELKVYIPNNFFVKPIKQKLLSEGFSIEIVIPFKTISLYEITGLLADKFYEDNLKREQEKEFLISWRKQ